MKKKILIAISAIIVVGIAVGFGWSYYLKSTQSAGTTDNATLASKTTFRRLLGKDTLVVGIDEEFPPITFKDASGNFTGVDIDFANEFAKRAGIKVIFKPVEWDSIIPALISGNIDVVWSGMGITAERQQQVSFAVYSRDPKGVAFVLADSSIKSKYDLKGKIIAVQSGSYQETDLKAGKIITQNSWKEIRSMSTLPEAIIDLKLGRVDAVICSQDSASYYIEKTLDESAMFKIVDVGYEIGAGGVAFRKSDDQLRQEAQKIIDGIIRDGTASKITTKWFGMDKYKNWDFNY